MLPVGVERDDRLRAPVEGVPEAAPQRCPLALVGLCRSTSAPAAAATAATVSSVEPSSTTRTGRCSSVARTTGSSVGAAW